MKFRSFYLSLLLLLYTPLSSADWKQVGKAEYNWGPFHVYTISLFTENGTYSTEQRPLMLRIAFAKPVEGKNFAISMIKEMPLNSMKADEVDQLRKRLIKNFPDFKTGDVLNYIALDNEGYFVVNDTVLSEHFNRSFNHQFISVWLNSESSFKQLQPRLLGEGKEKENIQEQLTAEQNNLMAPAAIRYAATKIAAEDANKLINTTLAGKTLSAPLAEPTINQAEKEQLPPAQPTVSVTPESAAPQNPPAINTNQTTQSETSALVETEKTMQEQALDSQTAPATDGAEDINKTAIAVEETAPISPVAESAKPRDDEQPETDKPENAPTPVDPEQPITPAQEVDPIMFYQQKYYC